jgi:hypothetical protein
MTTAEATKCSAGEGPVHRRVVPQPGAVRGAYADPPYLGCGVKHYGTRHTQAAEYDDPAAHRRLVERLCDEFDCWALSLHEPSLRVILPMCPDDVRVGTWVKPFAAFKKNVTRAWTWEPVIFRFSAARPRLVEQPTWRDNESEHLSSSLIRRADAIADEAWTDRRHYTYVDPKEVASANPGYCFICAGWRRCGVTKRKALIVLEAREAERKAERPLKAVRSSGS